MVYNTLEEGFFGVCVSVSVSRPVLCPPAPPFHTGRYAAPALSIASYFLARVRQGQSDHLCSAQTRTVEEDVKSVKKLNKKF